MTVGNNASFIEDLQGMVARRNANLNHPFAVALKEGSLTRDQLRCWAGQRYKGITGMGMDHFGQLFVRAPDDHVRAHIWEVLGEEGGYAGANPSHSAWLFTFGAALGMTTDDFEQTQPLPETIAVRSFYLNKLHQEPFLSAFAAVVAVESENPTGFPVWAKALEAHYGLKHDDLAWFLGHVEADSEDSGHAGVGWQILADYAITDELREEVRTSVREALEIYWLSLDGIVRAFVG